MKDKRFVFIVFAIIAIVVLGLVVLFSDNVIFFHLLIVAMAKALSIILKQETHILRA